MGLLECRSSSPQSFFKCVLDGKIVPPGLPALEYKKVLKGELAVEDMAPAALLDALALAALLDDSDDEI